MTTITLSKSDAAGVKTDAVVIGVVKLGGGVTLPAGTESLNAAYGGKLVEVLSGLGATGKAGEVTKVPGPKPGKSATLIAVGLGAAPDGALKTEDLRTAAGAGVRAVKTAQSVAFALPAPDAECVRAIAEGALLGRYSFTAYKSSDGTTEAPGNVDGADRPGPEQGRQGRARAGRGDRRRGRPGARLGEHPAART